MSEKGPFRADHVGSLLRPESVHAARREYAAGDITAEQLRAIEDDAIRDAVAMQEAAGLPVVTDGEFRRANFMTDFLSQLGGVNETRPTDNAMFRNDQGEEVFAPTYMRVDGKVSLEHPIFADDFRFLSDIARGTTAKMTMPSPSAVYYRAGRGGVDETAYPDLDAFWSDLSAAYAAQLTALGEIGCKYAQLDDTSFAYVNDPKQRAEVSARGDDPDHLHEKFIAQINAAVSGRPADMTLAVHTCRGNARSAWVAEGSYDFVAEALFTQLDVDGFFLEYDDERSGGFEPLRFVPPGKRVVLGLVTSKRGELEDKDALKRRIEEASKFIDVDQLCISPQCGFASSEEGNLLTFDQEKAKLELIVETATEVWGTAS